MMVLAQEAANFVPTVVTKLGNHKSSAETAEPKFNFFFREPFFGFFWKIKAFSGK
jgi:hypothetical protein